MRIRLVGLLSVLVLFTDCARVAKDPAHPALRIAQRQEPSALNPLLLNGTVGMELGSLVYSYLLKLDAEGRLIPDLALRVPTIQNGDIARDGLHITYHLRRGVRFSDGAPLTARDVIFTWHAVMNPRNLIQSRLGYDQIAAISAPDPSTVTLTLKRRYAPILVQFCAPGNDYPIMPEHILAHYADLNAIDFNQRPIGSGPYRVVDWRRGDRVVLAANATYFGGKPKIERLELVFTPDLNAIVNRIASGEVDGMVYADPSVAPALETLHDSVIDRTPIDGVGALIFNTRAAPTNDLRVREALSSAIDVSSLIFKASHGVYTDRDAGRGLFMWAYDRGSLRMPAYNIAHAKALLNAAGWRVGSRGVREKNGVALDVLLISEKDSPVYSTIASAVQEAARQIDVRVSIKEFVVTQFAAPAALGGPVYGGKFNIAFYPFLPGLDPDVTDQFACNRIPPAGFNKPRYCNPQMDAAIARGIDTFDTGARKVAYHAAQRLLSRDLPMLLLYQTVNINVFPKWLKGEHTAVTTPYWNVATWSR